MSDFKATSVVFFEDDFDRMRKLSVSAGMDSSNFIRCLLDMDMGVESVFVGHGDNPAASLSRSGHEANLRVSEAVYAWVVGRSLAYRGGAKRGISPYLRSELSNFDFGSFDFELSRVKYKSSSCDRVRRMGIYLSPDLYSMAGSFGYDVAFVCWSVVNSLYMNSEGDGNGKEEACGEGAVEGRSEGGA